MTQQVEPDGPARSGKERRRQGDHEPGPVPPLQVDVFLAELGSAGRLIDAGARAGNEESDEEPTVAPTPAAGTP